MKKQSGFTLIELLITIAIAAVLLTLAAPSFVDTIRRNRIATQANEILSALNLARSEAVKRSRDVTVCPRQSTSSTACGGAGDWANGWVVRANGSDLRVGEPLRTGTTFTGTESLVTFGPNGGASFASGAEQSTWVMTLDDKQRTIVINRQGRASVEPN